MAKGDRLAKGANGRDGRGRFVPGCPAGPGNPLAARVARLRAALLSAVSDADVRAIFRKQIDQARAGDLAAAAFVLDRTVGKPASVVSLDQAFLQEHEIDQALNTAVEWLADRRQAGVVEPGQQSA